MALAPIIVNLMPAACRDVAAICWMEAHPGMGSWAQAVGTVLALGGAFLIAQMPIREERRRHRDAQGRLLNRVIKRAEEVVSYTATVLHLAATLHPDPTMMLEAHIDPMLAANRDLEEMAWGIIDKRAFDAAREFISCADFVVDRAREAQRAKFMEEEPQRYAGEGDRYAVEGLRALKALKVEAARFGVTAAVRRGNSLRDMEVGQ